MMSRSPSEPFEEVTPAGTRSWKVPILPPVQVTRGSVSLACRMRVVQMVELMLLDPPRMLASSAKRALLAIGRFQGLAEVNGQSAATRVIDGGTASAGPVYW